MRYWITIINFLVFSFNFLHAQTEKYIEHRVEKGETITQIAKKYDVSKKDLFKLNPDAQNGVNENGIILIPIQSSKGKTKEASSNQVGKKHTVKTKETLYSIAKNYDIEVEDIENVNPEIVKNGIAIGQVLIIPNKQYANKLKSPSKESKSHKVSPKETLYSIAKQYDVTIESIQNANLGTLNNGISIGQVIAIPNPKTPGKYEPETPNNNTKAIYHEVLAKETKYFIAKKYAVSIEQLEKQNPEIVNGLQLGYKLLIKGEREAPKTVQTTIVKSDDASLYTIKPKETLYSISNQLNITQEELLKLNPELKNGVKEGLQIKIPKNTSNNQIKKEYKDLAQSIKKENRKRLALLLPFNISKLDKDTINSIKSRLQKDKFLNMTLDFYAGALMAIDSVKKMGLNVEVKIYDSNETKSSSNIENLIKTNNLRFNDAIIGPFYQNNVEKTAELLKEFNVPVISPLSKDYDKDFSNLVQATPTPTHLKKAMFDYMHSKSGNMIAIIDPKKVTIKQYISDNHKDVLFSDINEAGNINVENLKSQLVKGKVNFVIMETEKTNHVINIINTLEKLLKEFDIKLVVLGENQTLDSEDIAINKLTKLGLLYPSQIALNNTPQSIQFENKFRKVNKILPNLFATRGFDVTFDVLLRLSQEKSFYETLNETATQQIENKFLYTQKEAGSGYTNTGVHILFYDLDLTIKEAK
jgi:LysM repeat protein